LLKVQTLCSIKERTSIDIRWFFITGAIGAGVLKVMLQYISTIDNLADIFTKAPQK